MPEQANTGFPSNSGIFSNSNFESYKVLNEVKNDMNSYFSLF